MSTKHLLFVLFAMIIATTCLAQGTLAPTLVKDLEASGGSDPKDFCTRSTTGSKLFFTAKVGGKRDLFYTDGTAAGTVRVTTLQDDITSAIGAANLIFFTTASKKLYKTDGSANGTIMLKQFTVLNRLGGTHLPNKLLFGASTTDTGNQYQLWESDGTVANTVLLRGPGTDGGDYPKEFCFFANKVYFIAHYATGGLYGRGLIVSDGTAAGTSRLFSPPATRSPSDITVAGGKLYFSENIRSATPEPWVSDGTTAGTRNLVQINPNGGSGPKGFVYWNKNVYFTAEDGNGLQLFDGTGKKIAPLGFRSPLCVSGSTLYYGAKVASGSTGDWYSIYRLSTVNTLGIQVAPFSSPLGALPARTNGNAGSEVPLHIVANPTSAKVFVRGDHLFAFNTTTAARSVVQPGVAPSTAPIKSDLFTYNGYIYFAADYTGQGAELYKVQ